MLSWESFYNDGKEKFKFLTNVWDVVIAGCVKLLMALSALMASAEIISGNIECLAVVDCPSASKSRTNSSWSPEHLKFPKICLNFYQSQNTSFVKRTEVISDNNMNTVYQNFVNSECNHDSLTALWAVLFIEAFILLVLNGLWLKIPYTSSRIETFVDVMIECFNCQCRDNNITRILSPHISIENEGDLENPINDNNADNLSNNTDSLPDSATKNTVIGLYEKVKSLNENLSSSWFFSITFYYELKSFFQMASVASFCYISIFLIRPPKGIIKCTLTQHIPFHHDYFLCSYRLAAALSWIFKIYMFFLAVCASIFNCRLVSAFIGKFIRRYNYIIHGEELRKFIGDDSLPGELRFLLQRVYSINKVYVIRFALFLPIL